MPAMLRRGWRGLAIAGALVLVLVLAGCGGGGGDDDTSDTTTTEAAEDETTTDAETADDPDGGEMSEPADPTEPVDEPTTTADEGDDVAAIADQVDLTLEDVTEYDPSFVEDLGDDEDEEDAEDDDLDDCVGEVADLEPVAESEGRAFEADLAYTASATSVMASEDEAVTIVDAFGGEEFRGCFEAYLSTDGLTAQLDSYPSGARFGDQWAIVAGSLGAEGQTFGVELHIVRTGALVTIFLHLDLGDSGEATAVVIDGLLTLIDERQAAAVG